MNSNCNKNIILFGCGEMGYQVLNILGTENVVCFCDNNRNLHGTVKWNKQVISVEQLKNEYNNFIVIICVRISKMYNIAFQLDQEGIANYWIYPMIEKYIRGLSTDELIQYLQNKDVMHSMKIHCYQNKISDLKKQLDYMKRHVDIRMMTPATGSLRKRQLALTDLGEFVCSVAKKMDVFPILYAGNLIGYIRHNGFVPWDDDMDFMVIRNEYERLYQYCLTQQDEEGFVVFQDDNRKERLKFIEHYNRIALAKEFPEQPKVAVEFFSLDYYADGYPFETFRSEAKKIHEEVYKFKSEKEKIQYVRKKIKENPFVVEKSSSIFFGFDNMDSVIPCYKENMIPEQVMFPLKQIKFEGKDFWGPNNPEELLTYSYNDIWHFPEDVGISKHVLISEN